MTRAFAVFLGLVGVCWATGCDRPAPDLAEWTVADHHHQAEKKQRRQMGKPPSYAKPSERNTLVEVTWVKQCASCHGKRGRGDGPQSPMVKAKDLTMREWQDSVTDDAIAKVIREGKNKMPSFNLPDSTVSDLVAHVRKFGLEKPRPGAPGVPSAAPAEAAEDEAEGSEEAKPSAAPAPKDGTAKNEPPARGAHPPPAAGTPNPGH